MMTVQRHEKYLERCYSLARLAGKDVGKNPNVGAVIVHKDTIIGEGYHKVYGGPHAEINALHSVKRVHKELLKDSTLYVSLEPCCIDAKTPPCTSAILSSGITEVHIGTTDPFPGIAGKGVEFLQKAGIKVVLYNDDMAKQLIAPFVTFHLYKRPFVTLKFAKSKYHYMGKAEEQIWLSNDQSNVYTHKVRSLTDAILIGTNTAIWDDPSLTTRHYDGPSPLRLVFDMNGRIPLNSKLLSDGNKTIVFIKTKRQLSSSVKQVLVSSVDSILSEIIKYCHQNNIVNLMVEGGAQLLKTFIMHNIWDKAVIIDTAHSLNEGIKAPNLHGKLVDQYHFDSDNIKIIENEYPIFHLDKISL